MESLDAYIRVSRVSGREGESYISPSVQRERIERWAEYHGIQIAEWHTDEDWSGGAPHRPGLDAAIARCLAGQTGGIVSANIDRFSRLTEKGLGDLRRLEDAGARLAFVQENIDVSGPVGKLMYTIMLAWAEYFLAQIKQAWVVAKTRAVNRGAVIGPTPLGYQRGDDGRLEPGELAPVVAEAFRLAAVDSLQAATRHLAANVTVDYVWTASHTRRLLARRVYLGESRYGDLVRSDAHEPLVSRAIWEAAQSSPRDRKPNERFPLSGVLRCGTCEMAMVGGRGGKGQRTYRCSGTLALSRSRCAQGATITAELVEGHVRDRARALLAGITATISDPEADALTLLERAIAEAEAELDAFAADLTMRRALGERYHAHLQARIDAVEAARAKYREHAERAARASVIDVDAWLADDELLLASLRSIWDRIVVVPGRRPVTERVSFIPVDADGAAGMAGAEDA